MIARPDISPPPFELECTGCIVCDAKATRPLIDFTPADLPKHRFHIDRCTACGTAFINPHPNRQAVNTFFSNERIYLQTVDPDGRQRRMIDERLCRKKEFTGYARRLCSMIPSGRVLDIGCGLGLFLEILGPNHTRLGLDINALAVRYVKQHLGLDVLQADAMDVSFRKSSFDMVSIMQTLDHFAHPGRILARVSTWLKTGGVLFLSSLINTAGPMARFFKEDFRLLHPFHMVYFTPRVIREILIRFGFKVVRLEYPFFRTSYCNRQAAVQLVVHTFGRLFQRKISGSGRRYLSPPFPGNTMNVYAVKTG
jgi:SAM-dependent methyltransferase